MKNWAHAMKKQAKQKNKRIFLRLKNSDLDNNDFFFQGKGWGIYLFKQRPAHATDDDTTSPPLSSPPTWIARVVTSSMGARHG